MDKLAAKWNDQGETHPLICHMIDSGQVAKALWQHGLTDDSRQQMAKWMGISEEEALRMISFWTALHDLGKATPTFQGKCEPARTKLSKDGYVFPPITRFEMKHHSLLSAWALEELQNEIGLTPKKSLINLLVCIGGHHGIFPSFGEIRETTYKRINLGDNKWQSVRTELVKKLRELFNPPPSINLPIIGADANAFFGILSGFLVTSDWLASQNEYFPYQTTIESVENYFRKSNLRALHSLKVSGWMGWKPSGSQVRFQELFTFYPSKLQKTAIELSKGSKEPFLMILEAPTGSGKTEIALYVAGFLIQKSRLRGCYVAMPTQATSEQMFGRVENFLLKLYPGQSINLHLVHGNALINKDFQNLLVSAVSDDEEVRSGVNAMGWFAPRKRTLLAPFGVGTVDQAFLGVLQTRHFFLRLFGLFRKVIIFDEVHAYDVYMVEIFKRLLAWLRAIGSSVIILSATLPEKTRIGLLNAYDHAAHLAPVTVDFPRLSINENHLIHIHHLGKIKSREVFIRKMNQEPDQIVKLLKEKISLGGCAAIICNTVGRAQEVYQIIKNANILNPDEITLFHSRFPYCWRETREKKILSFFGKLDAAPTVERRGVVVATQVIEQSLDLDFDLLVSDLAPIDLLIQRIGRLHRHSAAKYPPIRPEGLAEPECYVCMPDTDEDGMARLKDDRYIYAGYIMQRSYFIVQESDALMLPSDTDRLIEAVYSPPPMAKLSEVQNDRLTVFYKQMDLKQDQQTVAAENRMVSDVNYSNLLGGGQVSLEEDDPHTHRDLQALTRDIQPTITLVCLLENEDGSLSLLDGNIQFSPEDTPRGPQVGQLLRSSVSVSDRRIVEHFNNQPRYEAWRDISQLRYAYPIQFKEGKCLLSEKLIVRLSPELGLFLESTR